MKILLKIVFIPLLIIILVSCTLSKEKIDGISSETDQNYHTVDSRISNNNETAPVYSPVTEPPKLMIFESISDCLKLIEKVNESKNTLFINGVNEVDKISEEYLVFSDSITSISFPSIQDAELTQIVYYPDYHEFGMRYETSEGNVYKFDIIYDFDNTMNTMHLNETTPLKSVHNECVYYLANENTDFICYEAYFNNQKMTIRVYNTDRQIADEVISNLIYKDIFEYYPEINK